MDDGPLTFPVEEPGLQYGALSEYVRPETLAGESFEPLVLRNIKPKGKKTNYVEPPRNVLGGIRAGIDSIIIRHNGKSFGNMSPGTIDSEVERSIQQLMNLFEQLPVNTEVPVRNIARDEIARAIELITGRTVTFDDPKFKSGRNRQRKLPGTD